VYIENKTTFLKQSNWKWNNFSKT